MSETVEFRCHCCERYRDALYKLVHVCYGEAHWLSNQCLEGAARWAAQCLNDAAREAEKQLETKP